MPTAYISSSVVLLNFNFSREATREVEAVHCFIYYSLKGGRPFWRTILRKKQTVPSHSPSNLSDCKPESTKITFLKSEAAQKKDLIFLLSSSSFLRGEIRRKIWFHSRKAGEIKMVCLTVFRLVQELIFLSEDIEHWAKPPLDLQGWTLHVSTWVGSRVCLGKERLCKAGGLCTQFKFQIMRNRPICNINYCQLLPQNTYVANITPSEIIVCYFHVFTLWIYPDTFVIKVLTSKCEVNVICDLQYTQIYQDKENNPGQAELKKSHSFIVFRYYHKKRLQEENSCLFQGSEFMSWTINSSLNYKWVDKSIYLMFNELKQ